MQQKKPSKVEKQNRGDSVSLSKTKWRKCRKFESSGEREINLEALSVRTVAIAPTSNRNIKAKEAKVHFFETAIATLSASSVRKRFSLYPNTKRNEVKRKI